MSMLILRQISAIRLKITGLLLQCITYQIIFQARHSVVTATPHDLSLSADIPTTMGHVAQLPKHNQHCQSLFWHYILLGNNVGCHVGDWQCWPAINPYYTSSWCRPSVLPVSLQRWAVRPAAQQQVLACDRFPAASTWHHGCEPSWRMLLLACQTGYMELTATWHSCCSQPSHVQETTQNTLF